MRTPPRSTSLPTLAAFVLAGIALNGVSTVMAQPPSAPSPKGTPAPPAPTTQPAAAAPAGGLPASLAGFSDEGTFILMVNEETIATQPFTWRPDGTLEAGSTLTMAGQSVKQSLKIIPGADGRWAEMTLDTPLGPATVKRDGAAADITFKEKTQPITLKEGTVLFENMTPVLMSLAVMHYDREKGGKQSFPLFIVPRLIMEASLEKQERVKRTIGGRDLTFTRYLYAVPGVDIIVWADDDHRVYLAEVPSQQAAYVREGYESLRQSPEVDPLLSQPTHEIREERGVGVPMRDGLTLSTDLFLPVGDGPFPVILVRTPYKKEMMELTGRFYARRGYVMAVQDCRGRFGSPGTWEPFVNEPNDGYDAIEWLAARPWSNGKVGMIGASYLGWVQWWAAGQNPPHLVTIIPNVSPPDPFYNIPYEYGAFFLYGAIWWADVLESEATADLSGAAFSKIGDKKYHKLLRALPVIDLDKSVLGKENPYWRKWIAHPTNDDYWRAASFLDRLAGVRIPVFHQSGWFDGDGIGSKLNYLHMAQHGHPHQKLVLGPWGHSPEAHRTLGVRDFGPDAIVDLPRDYLRWFDYWLRGVDNGITREPLVSLFIMHSNAWVHGDKYPLPQTKFEKWYLASAGSANTSTGDGVLSTKTPPADSPPDRFVYDPADPTPSPALYEDPDGDDESKTKKSVEEELAAYEAWHTQLGESRQDMLVYTSAPMERPLTIAGPVSAVLYAASSARDTDWFMRLVEVDDQGRLFALVEGRLRARFRESMSAPTLLEPDKIYEYKLDLWQTGITIRPGHRLRVEVASASFPLFSRNLNTGGHNETESEYVPARQTIYHDAQHPSHVLLPVIPTPSPGVETRRLTP